MDGFSGIRPEAIWLLAENRFHDSREFYEEHKAQLKTQIVEPLRRLVEDLAPAALKIDPQIIANPMQNGCVSRIRRDNRYTRDKSLYRENMWIVLMRDKKAWDALHAFFADFSPRGANFGMGVYHESPRLMQILRRHLEENPEPFRRALRKAEKAGFALSGDRYARPKKAGLPADIDSLYNRKWWDFSRMEPDPAFYADPTLPDILRQSMETLAPMYRLMIRAMEEELETREQEEPPIFPAWDPYKLEP